jgi:hypothetical protein
MAEEYLCIYRLSNLPNLHCDKLCGENLDESKPEYTTDELKEYAEAEVKRIQAAGPPTEEMYKEYPAYVVAFYDYPLGKAFG